MNVFYRVVMNGLRHAQRAAGTSRMRLHIRRAALSLQRQIDAATLAD